MALVLHQPVSVLQRQIDSVEFAEWKAFATLQPLGPLRDDVNSAIICKAVAETFTGKAHKLIDFILDYDWKPKTPEEMFEIACRSARKKVFKKHG